MANNVKHRAGRNLGPLIQPEITLPDRRVIYWLQSNMAGDDVLPPPRSGLFKLACSTTILDRSEIVTRWPEREHKFVIVKFPPLVINRSRLEVQQAA